MYLSHFGLNEAPFSIAPDPRYLYMSERHREALAHLLYGVNGGGGFVLLTGEVGAGKTTVCRCLLEQVPASCDVAYIFNPRQTACELLATICGEFGIEYPVGNTSGKVFVDCINAFLLDAHARGRHTVLIIDEAQNLSFDVLEQIRLLTNLETNQRKLLQIILLGQPELAVMLDKPELSQLAQRIIARYHLEPLARHEVAAYVTHRLGVAGTQKSLFPQALMKPLFRMTGGIPRIINVLCDRALLGAYVQGHDRVNRATLMQASREVFNKQATRSMRLPLLAGLLAATVLAATQYLPAAPAPPVMAPSVKIIPVAAKPAEPAALPWPPAEPLARSEVAAYTALFSAWGTNYQGENPCLQAESIGLRCLTGRGGLDELRQIDRPAVLLMHDDRGEAFHATLTRLDEQSATFTTGTENRTLPLSDIAAQWSGHYTLLSRMPPAANRPIRPGDRGPDVARIAHQLAQIDGHAAEPAKDPVFDQSMMNQIRQFQLLHGLTPDGAIGAQTMMRISTAADLTAPGLLRAKKKE
ncbi:MAG: AAA family ATPase [Gallionella sp.]|nr:AAA family ATPase [Gallionella sp.]